MKNPNILPKKTSHEDSIDIYDHSVEHIGAFHFEIHKYEFNSEAFKEGLLFGYCFEFCDSSSSVFNESVFWNEEEEELELYWILL